MRLTAAPILFIALISAASAETKTPAKPQRDNMSPNQTQTAAPALEKYRQNVVVGDLWKRPELSPRDRSVVTLAVVVTRNQTEELIQQLGLALDNGVKPKEISEIITHLAFYSGLGNAASAAAVVSRIFKERGITSDQLPTASPQPLPLDQAAEATRAARVIETTGSVSPGLVKFTGDLLFKDLWLRPDLAPRDRSLATVSSLIASGQFAQITFHLNKAMDNGLSEAEAGEVLTQTAFYAGWPNAFSAVPVFKSVFDGRK
jgi:4-carboxymuconolactone decarboxylase